jgi:hypothetical protein
MTLSNLFFSQNRFLRLVLIVFYTSCLSSCSGPNPNPGERTADILWSQYKHEKAINIIKPKAEEGLPWAQLRMGVAYQLGNGVKKDFDLALHWYKKVATQNGEGGWANGKLVGAFGKPGYFNQNSDAMVAQYQISTIYLSSDKKHEDIIKAYLWINYVIARSNGMSIFYCCEFSGGRWIPQSLIRETLAQINKKITPKQKEIAEATFKTWNPLQDL